MIVSKQKIRETLFGLFRKEKILKYIFAAVLVWMGVYRLGELTMPIILDDEFGYWSNSMLFMGKDWTDLTGRINYYSYGYSLILCLIQKVAAFCGYGWTDLYKVAVVFNIIFGVAGYFLSVKIAERYMKHLNWIMIPVVCFVAAIYPSSMLYTHITLTECTLSFLFWIFAYTMMRVIDKPSIANHIGLSAIVIYMYTVHQRTLGLVLTAILIIIVLRLLKRNSLRQTTAFLGSVYILYMLHSIVKSYVRNVNYLGKTLDDMGGILSIILTKSMFAIFAVIVAVLFWLYILDKGKVKLGLALLVSAVVIACGAVSMGVNLVETPGGGRESILAINELSGQIGMLKKVFTKYGLIRLGTSVVGKWYYLAAATGLVICWGLRDLFLNAIFLVVDGCRRIVKAIRGKEHDISTRICTDFEAHIFLLGMFLSFASAFMINALYKEGFYKVDDLINGRYIEYLIGFVLVYSVDRMMADRHWIWFWFVYLGAYLAAGAYCQYAYDQLQRTEYELIHAVVFGRIFWNYESPTGKIKEVARYVVPFAAGFVLISRIGSSGNKASRLVTLRLVIALMLPVGVWNHIYTEIVDHYVVVRNQKQSGAAPQIAEWTKRLSGGENIYFINDWLSYRQGEILQYMIGPEKLHLTKFGKVDFDEDALFILNKKLLNDDIIKDKCEVVDTKGSYALVVNKNQKLADRWRWYDKRLHPLQHMEYIEEN
ncbi:MAG: hypothetical protein K1W16_15995 [Lachnospiraceae bacterium]